MTGLSEEGGLRDEIGSSSINSPRRKTSRSFSFGGAFRDKENQDAEARATSVATVTAASASPPDGSPRESTSVPRGGKPDVPLFGPAPAPVEKLSSGPSTESLFGPPKVRRLKASDTADVRPGGGTVIGDHGRSSTDCNGGGIEQPQAFFSPRNGLTWSAGGSGGSSNVLRGAPWLRAKRRVALSLARARGVPVHTPKTLVVPSKLMHSTAASLAAAFTPPAPVRPRFIPRRCYLGKVVTGGPPKGAEKNSAVRESRRKGATSRMTTSSSAGIFKKHELLRERRGFVLSAEFDDEMTAAPASAMGTSFATIASIARSVDPDLSISRPHSRTGGWTGSMPPLSPLARCEGQCSRELEEGARRRSEAGYLNIGDGGACPWMRSETTSKVRLEISLEAVEPDDDVLMSPCASVGSSSASKEEAFVESAPVDSVASSSTGRPWSMVSSVCETKREPNAREGRLSGGDPVARMLLKQSDDLVESDGVSDDGDGGACFARGSPSPLVGVEKRIMVPLVSPRAGRPSIFGVEERNACFGINTSIGLGGGRSTEAGDREHASTISSSIDLGGGSACTATFWGERGSGSGVPGRTSFSGFFGGVFDSDRGKVGSSGMESERERHFRPITSPRL